MAETRQTSIVERLASGVARAEQARTAAPGEADDVAAYASVATKDAVLASILPGQQLRAIRVEFISPAPEGQVRQHFDEDRLKTLAESLKRSGVREPIIVTPHGAGPGRFQIVAGERRWRAAQLAGLSEIPCIVDPSLEDRRAKILAQAEENLQREDLNPVEEAAVLAQLMETRGVEVREAGELIGRSYSQARRLYRIHMAIEPIKRALICGEIDARAAIEVDRIFNALAAKASKEEAQHRAEKLLERIVRERWPIRRIEAHAKKVAGGAAEEAEDGLPHDAVGDSPVTPTEPHGGADAEHGAPRSAADAPERRPDPEASRGPMAPLLTRENGRVVIEEARIQRGKVTPEEREQLIAVLEELLMRVRRA